MVFCFVCVDPEVIPLGVSEVSKHNEVVWRDLLIIFKEYWRNLSSNKGWDTGNWYIYLPEKTLIWVDKESLCKVVSIVSIPVQLVSMFTRGGVRC